MKKLPYLKEENGVTSLYVDGEPYIALGGEIHNSSSSNLEYMKEKVWPFLRNLHLNTLCVPVFWELIEPEQDEFDFALLDGIIEQARTENVRLVLLWFGLWKNGASSYAPSWVKRDYRTYFRAFYPGSVSSDTISPLCDAAIRADAKAFRRLMSRLKEIDGGRHTVIMVQVENEIGFLNSARDCSELADEEFGKPVPVEVSAAFGTSGNWTEAFGEEADEYFMAYHYARAVEQIAKTGAEEYTLPMFVNAWLEQFPERPGAYPSGGPIAKVIKMWKLIAPSICLYAPDIYLANFADVCKEYTADGNPLFIPEARRDLVSATNVFYALGKHNALCFSPFGIEDFLAPPVNLEESGIDIGFLTALNIDASAFIENGTGPYLAQSYKLLGNMLGIIQRNRGTGKMTGFLENHDKGCILPFAKFDLKITYMPRTEGKPISGGLVIEVSDEEFILAGVGFSVQFLPKRGERSQVGIIKIEEGTFENNEWKRGRRLNGDEGNLKIVRNPSVLCVEIYKYG